MNDDELKKRFDELKRHDARRAPTFEATIAKKRPQSIGARIRPLFAVVPIVAAAACLVFWCGTANKASAPAPTAVIRPPRIRVQAQAAMPTDFLLDTAATMTVVRLDTSSGLLP
jgi:hypothetical protein